MDKKAFLNQVLPLKDKLFRFALTFVKNKEEANDLVQDTYIKLWTQALENRTIRNMEAWSMRMLRNMALDHLRSHAVSRTSGMEGHMEIMRDRNDPYKQTEINDSMQQVRSIIEKLPQDQMQVIHLREMEDMSYEEICEVTEMSMSQVKTNLFRARQKIRAQLQKVETYGLS